MRDTHSVTPHSVARAKAAQRTERERVEHATGLRFIGDRLVDPIRDLDVTPCKAWGCLFVAAGYSEAERADKLWTHWRKAHAMVQAPREVA